MLIFGRTYFMDGPFQVILTILGGKINFFVILLTKCQPAKFAFFAAFAD